MIKHLKRSLFALAAGLAALTSCAEAGSESYEHYESRSLEAWITQHRPELLGNKQTPGGYYIDVLDAGDPDCGAVSDTLCWVLYDFSGRDLGGSIVLTRQASDAILDGTFTKYTHYVPFYRFCGDKAGTGLQEGTWLAMRNTLTLGEEYFEKYRKDPERRITSRELKLREGSRIRIYMPSSVTGGSVEGSGGYEGQYSLDAGRPMIATIEIRDTVKNPLAFEGNAVDAFCKASGGLKIYKKESDGKARDGGKNDSVIPSDPEDKDHPYNVPEEWVSACDTVAQLYVNYRYAPDRTLTFEEPYHVGYEPYAGPGSVEAINERIAEALQKRFHPDEKKPYAGVAALDADSVKLEGEARIWYIGRFLDGFIFDTNIDEVKEIIYGEKNTKGETLKYKPSEGALIRAFYYIVPNLKFGQWAALVTTSTNAYGAAGKSGSTSTSTSGSSSSNYVDYVNYMNYMNSYYGSGGYYGGYYNNYYGGYGGYGGYYGGYYDPYGYGYTGSSTEQTTTTTTVSTEIPAYSPLLFQFYVEPASKK